MYARNFVQAIASLIWARANCKESGNTEWYVLHGETIESLVRKHMPSGSGIDNGVQFDLDTNTNPDRLVFTFGFHHMDENGSYDGWTDHGVIVTPSLASGFYIEIIGPDRNDIKEYLHQVFDAELRRIVSAHCDACGHPAYGRVVWDHSNPEHSCAFKCDQGHETRLEATDSLGIY